jgi:ubiquinone/menaquinone biosynthesis C-methylase UbiE
VCSLAQLLAQRTGLNALASYQTGDLLALPFPDRGFDVVWTQHVVMNIQDRERVYREFRRILMSDGKLAFFDALAADTKPELHFGVSPTKVRKVPQDSCQLPGRKGFPTIPELPRRDLV